ncbi:MAG: hypothetical protein KDA41_21505 [Planctomycetales bacterium]|nr:hypothetical protein [Planctomycetales bacterium]
MHLLELTLPTAAENIALDEALLDAAEAGGRPQETLRLWEADAPLVVIGRASAAAEVDLPICRERGVSVLRRNSGGAAVAAGPGCWMYALVLSLETRPDLRMIDRAHQFALGALADALNRALPLPRVAPQGVSDLTLDGQVKFSGNSLRVCRTHLLYHGTLLYDFPLKMIAELLRSPPRQPAYRAGRSHLDFVGNLPLSRAATRSAVIDAWQAELSGEVGPPPDALARVASLVREKYAQDEWNLQR